LRSPISLTSSDPNSIAICLPSSQSSLHICHRYTILFSPADNPHIRFKRVPILLSCPREFYDPYRYRREKACKVPVRTLTTRPRHSTLVDTLRRRDGPVTLSHQAHSSQLHLRNTHLPAGILNREGTRRRRADTLRRGIHKLAMPSMVHLRKLQNRVFYMALHFFYIMKNTRKIFILQYM
jgi:hypothetical protein